MGAHFGRQLPLIVEPPPGPASRALARRLRAVESHNVTFIGEHFPVFWDAAEGANVRDADGNVYVDLTAAFGVALAGHRPPVVAAALADQGVRLVHGMGDVHPPTAKVVFLEALARILPWTEPRTVLGTSGSEAVEIALKTARLASGRPGILAFDGGYHGLTLGALATTARQEFRAPVLERLFAGVTHVPFPESAPVGHDAADRTSSAVLARIDALLAADASIGTVIVEPVQARGGVRVMPRDFARGLMERARAHQLVVVADEIYVGMGRCGSVLASERVGLEPDVVCLGKVLGGGMPLSACVAPRAIMDVWPESGGEALHTSTFLGHPLACAAGTAMVAEIEAGLGARAEAAGRRLMTRLCAALGDEPRVALRGLGLLAGIEVRDVNGDPVAGAGARVAEAVLADGIIVLPAGDSGAVIELSPPVVVTDEQEAVAVDVVARAVRNELARST